jgi:hypothetical protein
MTQNTNHSPSQTQIGLVVGHLGVAGHQNCVEMPQPQVRRVARNQPHVQPVDHPSQGQIVRDRPKWVETAGWHRNYPRMMAGGSHRAPTEHLKEVGAAMRRQNYPQTMVGGRKQAAAVGHENYPQMMAGGLKQAAVVEQQQTAKAVEQLTVDRHSQSVAMGEDRQSWPMAAVDQDWTVAFPRQNWRAGVQEQNWREVVLEDQPLTAGALEAQNRARSELDRARSVAAVQRENWGVMVQRQNWGAMVQGQHWATMVQDLSRWPAGALEAQDLARSALDRSRSVAALQDQNWGALVQRQNWATMVQDLTWTAGEDRILTAGALEAQDRARSALDRSRSVAAVQDQNWVAMTQDQNWTGEDRILTGEAQGGQEVQQAQDRARPVSDRPRSVAAVAGLCHCRSSRVALLGASRRRLPGRAAGHCLTRPSLVSRAPGAPGLHRPPG